MPGWPAERPDPAGEGSDPGLLAWADDGSGTGPACGLPASGRELAPLQAAARKAAQATAAARPLNARRSREIWIICAPPYCRAPAPVVPRHILAVTHTTLPRPARLRSNGSSGSGCRGPRLAARPDHAPAAMALIRIVGRDVDAPVWVLNGT